MKNEPCPLIILGTGILAEEVADLISEIEAFNLIGFVENMQPEKTAQTLLGRPIIWINDIMKNEAQPLGICAIGTTQRQGFIEQATDMGLRFATVVHPTARISPTAEVGEGCIVSAGVIIGAHTRIGRHVFINRGSLIGHHTEIGDYVTIGPGANIAGKVRIGSSAYIAMGAIIIDKLTVGGYSVVGAGAVVTTDVPPEVQVVGVPARIVKHQVKGR